MNDPRKEQFDREGYCILENAIAQEELAMLREECTALTSERESEMENADEIVRDINHKGRRYFISLRHKDRPRLRRFLFSDRIAEICQFLIGDDVWLFNEQFVVKAAHVGMEFSWHQDSGYIPETCPHEPYLSLWCALDDIDATNGALSVLPFSRAATRKRIEHHREQGTNDLVGYSGDDKGEVASVSAGSIVAFTSVSFHRSAANESDAPRRAFLAQYSARPIIEPVTKKPWALATPFLRGGEKQGTFL